ncbi:YbhB/YbcL family Raf kinase inhibitor-like protein [Sphaerisporangium sp. B11E5]|uniref:YbhB/YbcL family Raf kinase inhibitor-like protein n=1 Tax=Sphaerisporangium sp. B11E5 TaxID=3153563 RepID=UPI00325DF662
MGQRRKSGLAGRAGREGRAAANTAAALLAIPTSPPLPGRTRHEERVTPAAEPAVPPVPPFTGPTAHKEHAPSAARSAVPTTMPFTARTAHEEHAIPAAGSAAHTAPPFTGRTAHKEHATPAAGSAAPTAPPFTGRTARESAVPSTCTFTRRGGRRRRASVMAGLVVVAGLAAGCGIVGGGSPTDRPLDTLSVSSPRFRDEAPLPTDYSCSGQEGNPPLRWSGVPQKQAKSIALVVDANSPQGAAEVHWVLFNIDPRTTELAQDSVPRGALQGLTSAGKVGYSPPCRRDDTYRFSVYALDSMLDLKEGAPLRDTMEHIASRTIARGRISAAHIE